RGVVGYGAGLLHDAVDLVDRDKQEFGLGINEGPYQPWARHSIYFHIGSRYPFHLILLRRDSGKLRTSSWMNDTARCGSKTRPEGDEAPHLFSYRSRVRSRFPSM